MIIIAEIGQNHNGEMDAARRLIHEAADAGADIAKFQFFDVDTVFGPQYHPNQEARRRAQVSRDQAEFLAEECAAAGIEFMASVFDKERVAWCEEIGMARYKIASRSVKDAELVKAIGATGKDVFISLGMWEEETFPVIPTTGHVDYLYCIAKYPASYEDLDLAHADFTRYSGFSDHSLGNFAVLVAVALGARIIEKHFTLDKSAPGPDHIHSVEPQEMREIVRFGREFERVLAGEPA